MLSFSQSDVAGSHSCTLAAHSCPNCSNRSYTASSPVVHRPVSPAQEVISDPMPVGCSERNLDLRFRAGFNTQRLRLWGAGVYKQRLQLMAHDLEYPREIPVTVMSAEDPQISGN